MDHQAFAVLVMDINRLTETREVREFGDKVQKTAVIPVRKQFLNYLGALYKSIQLGDVLYAQPEKVNIIGGTEGNVIRLFLREVRKLLFNNLDEIVVDVAREGRVRKETVKLMNSASKCPACVVPPPSGLIRS